MSSQSVCGTSTSDGTAHGSEPFRRWYATMSGKQVSRVEAAGDR